MHMIRTLVVENNPSCHLFSVLRQPQAPWEPRVFPLDEDEEEALLSYNIEKMASGLSATSAYSTSKRSNSHLCLTQSSGATSPSGEQSWDITLSGSREV